MVSPIKKFLFLLFICFSSNSFSQEGTRNSDVAGKTQTGKVCLVPFEPKLYMSEIDQKINQVTKWDWETIRENFRRQLNDQLKLKIQPSFSVLSFYADSVKMSKDLDYAYNSTGLSYDPVNKPSDAKSANGTKSGISNGQITVEQNSDKKFMNTKLTNAEVLTYLHKKYASEYFIFINQLDIKNDMNSYDVATDTYQREVTVHYSILDLNGKTIDAGVATSRFSSKENNPKKIVAQCFSPIATYIAAKFTATVNPSPVPQKN